VNKKRNSRGNCQFAFIGSLHTILPRVLVNDRDSKVVNGFWHSLWRRLGTRVNMSSSRHPETDRLTERFSNTFVQLLRYFVATMDRSGRICCLTWNLRTTLLVRLLELSALPSMPIWVTRHMSHRHAVQHATFNYCLARRNIVIKNVTRVTRFGTFGDATRQR
jgi:hypothetical protein